MNCNRPFVLAFAAAILLVPTSIAAHGTQYYVSTPFSVPRGWEWVSVLFLALCGLWYGWSLREEGKRLVRTIQFLGVTCLAMILSLMAGLFFTVMNTAPPPGFGFGYPPFTGYGWNDVGTLFIIGNLIGLSMVLGLIAAYLRIRVGIEYRINRIVFLAGIASVYLMTLLPFAAGQSMTFGWHGAYASMACRGRISCLELALAQYVIDHSERLPQVKTSEEFVTVLFPYVEDVVEKRHSSWQQENIFVCPIEESWNSNHQPYQFAVGLSGHLIKDILGRDPEARVISCYTKHNLGDSPKITVQDFVATLQKVR